MSDLPARQVYKFIDGFSVKTEFLEFTRSELGLSLKPHEINGVMEDYKYDGIREQKYQIISLWKRKKGRRADMQVLYNLKSRFLDDDDAEFDESSADSSLSSSSLPSSSRNDGYTDRRRAVTDRVEIPSETVPAIDVDNLRAHRQKSGTRSVKLSRDTGHETYGVHQQAVPPNQTPQDVDGCRRELAGLGCMAPNRFGQMSSSSTSQVIPEHPLHQLKFTGESTIPLTRGHTIPESSRVEPLPASLHETSVTQSHVDRKPQTQTADREFEQNRKRLESLKLKATPIVDEKSRDKAWRHDELFADKKDKTFKCKPEEEGSHLTSSASLAIDNTIPERGEILNSTICDEVKDLRVLKCSEADIDMILRKGDAVYAIRHKPKGYVVIVNYNFKEENKRIGANYDVKNMTDLWEGLDCLVTCKEDLKSHKFMELIENITKSKELEKYDFFVLFVMSHGNANGFKTVDGIIRVDHLLQKFDNHNAPYLNKKPKLFFFQFCRGRGIDHGFLVPGTIPAERADLQQYSELAYSDYGHASQTIRSDILVSYPTQDGFRSYRGDKGSWHINAIANIFSRYAKNEHVSEMMTRVRSAVQQKTGCVRDKKAPEYETANLPCKQIGEDRTLLSKNLYLMPGYP